MLFLTLVCLAVALPAGFSSPLDEHHMEPVHADLSHENVKVAESANHHDQEPHIEEDKTKHMEIPNGNVNLDDHGDNTAYAHADDDEPEDQRRGLLAKVFNRLRNK